MLINTSGDVMVGWLTDVCVDFAKRQEDCLCPPENQKRSDGAHLEVVLISKVKFHLAVFLVKNGRGL